MHTLKKGDRVRVVHLSDDSHLKRLFNDRTGKTVQVGDEGVVSEVSSVEVKVEGWGGASFIATQVEKIEDQPPTVPMAGFSIPAVTQEKTMIKKDDRLRYVNAGRGLRATLGQLATAIHDEKFGGVDVRWDNDIHPGQDSASPRMSLMVDQFEIVKPGDEWVKTPEGVLAQVQKVTAGGAKLVMGVYYDPARLTPTEAPETMSTVPEKADTMLRMVDVFLARNNAESKLLQHVLAALRGPDTTGMSKLSTTVPIRRAALPLTAKMAAGGGAANMDMGSSDNQFIYPTNVGHFQGHIRAAADSLKTMGREVK